MLVDTSVLVRTLQPHHPLYPPADHAIRVLPGQGRKLHIVAQNLIEVWVVATRPLGENGLGMTPAEAATELGRIKGMFLFLPETPAIYPAWEALVLDHAVSGKPSHDARLVAARSHCHSDIRHNRVFALSWYRCHPPCRSHGAGHKERKARRSFFANGAWGL